MKPMRAGSTPNSFARLRTSRMARVVSAQGVALHRVMRVLCLRQPVLQYECRDAMLIHPFGDVPSFLGDDELRMPAARGDHYGHPVGLLLRRQERVDRGVVDHGELFRQLRIVGGRKDLGGRLLLGARRAVRPETDLLAAFGAPKGGRKAG